VPLMPDTMPPGAQCNGVRLGVLSYVPSAALLSLACSRAGGVTADGSARPAPVTVRRAAIALMHHRHHMPQSRRGSEPVRAPSLEDQYHHTKPTCCKPCSILSPCFA
jgi:hypothetical protein